jgi:hypothetical protein
MNYLESVERLLKYHPIPNWKEENGIKTLILIYENINRKSIVHFNMLQLMYSILFFFILKNNENALSFVNNFFEKKKINEQNKRKCILILNMMVNKNIDFDAKWPSKDAQLCSDITYFIFYFFHKYKIVYYSILEDSVNKIVKNKDLQQKYVKDIFLENVNIILTKMDLFGNYIENPFLGNWIFHNNEKDLEIQFNID